MAHLPGLFSRRAGIVAYTHPTSDALYTIVDVTARVVYDFVFLGGILAIEKQVANAMGRSPREMDKEEYMPFTSELTRHEGAESGHKLAALSSDSKGAPRERGSTAPSGGETIYKADPEEVRVDRDDDDARRTPPRRRETADASEHYREGERKARSHRRPPAA
jgi:hypothetical protein